MKAPAFKLADQQGREHTLKQYLGSWLILYFYPKDMTTGCTQEACDFRDNLHRLKSKGAAVLGISADSQKRHVKFAEKESLTFPLLADEDHKVCEAYGVWQRKKMMGHEFDGIVRTTLIINPKGEIAKRYDKVKVTGHVDEVLKDLSAMK